MFGLGQFDTFFVLMIVLWAVCATAIKITRIIYNKEHDE